MRMECVHKMSLRCRALIYAFAKVERLRHIPTWFLKMTGPISEYENEETISTKKKHDLDEDEEEEEAEEEAEEDEDEDKQGYGHEADDWQYGYDWELDRAFRFKTSKNNHEHLDTDLALPSIEHPPPEKLPMIMICTKPKGAIVGKQRLHA